MAFCQKWDDKISTIQPFLIKKYTMDLNMSNYKLIEVIDIKEENNQLIVTLWPKTDPENDEINNIEILTIDSQNLENIYSHSIVKDLDVQNVKCYQFLHFAEINRDFWGCKNFKTNKSFIILSCSDKSCKDQFIDLKINDYKTNTYQIAKFKIFTGLRDDSLYLFAWFPNQNILEIVDINLKWSSTGKQYLSLVHEIDFQINSIFYAGNQLLMIQSAQSDHSYDFYFLQWDAYSNLFPGKFKKLDYSGKILEFNIGESDSQICVHIFDQKENNIKLLQFDSYDNSFIQLENYVNFGVNFQNSQIFSIGDFSNILIAQQSATEAIYYYNDKGKTYQIMQEDLPSQSKSPYFSKGKAQLILPSITHSGINFGFNIEVVQLNPQFYRIDGQLLEQGKENVLEIRQSNIQLGTEVVIQQNSNPFGTYFFNDTTTYLDGDELRLTTKQTSSKNIGMTLQIDEIMFGSFINPSKIEIGSNHTLQFKDMVNPVLRVEQIDLTPEFIKSGEDQFGFISIIHRSKRIENSLLFQFGKHRKTEVYRTLNGKLVHHGIIPIQIDNHVTAHIHNETYVILSSKDKAWGININEKQTSNQISELRFDQGICGNFMILNLQKVPQVFVCKLDDNIRFYLVNEMISGYIGASKLSVTLNGFLTFKGIQLRAFDEFQDYFYGISQDRNFIVYRIYSFPNLSISELSSKKLATGNLKFDKVLDFISIEDKIIVYASYKQRDVNRIVLLFYKIINAEEIEFTKGIKLDYNFSPSFNNTKLYNFNTQRTDKTKNKMKSKALVLLEVKMNYQTTQNILFIDPNSELIRTIPTLLFNFESKVNFHFGVSLGINTEYYENSFSILSWNQEQPKIKQISRVIVDDFKIDLKKLVENSTTNEIKIFFEEYNNLEGELKKIKILVDEDLRKQGEASFHSEFELKLDTNILYEMIEDYRSIPTFQWDCFACTVGDIVNFGIEPESRFEHITETIKFTNFYSRVEFEQSPDLLFPEEQNKCSNLIYIEVGRLKKSENLFIFQGQIADKYLIKFCVFNKSLDLVFQRIIGTVRLQHRTAVIIEQFDIDFNKDELQVKYWNNILKLYVIEKISGEMNYFIPIVIDLESKYTLTDDKAESIEKQITQIEEEYLSVCGNEFFYTPNYQFEDDLNRMQCVYKISSKLRYHIQWLILPKQIIWMVTEDIFFDFRVLSTEFKESMTYQLVQYQVQLIFNKDLSRGNLKIESSNYRLEITQESISSHVDPDKNYSKIKNILDKSGQDNKSQIEIDEDTHLDVIKHNFEGLWVLLETVQKNSYLLKFPQSMKSSEVTSPEDPKIISFSNYFYGETPLSHMPGIFEKWLYVRLKIFSDSSYLMVYNIPHSQLLKNVKDTQSHIYTSSIIKIEGEIKEMFISYSNGVPLSCNYYFITSRS